MAKGLDVYLSQEEVFMKESQVRWGPELKAIEDLALLYANLNKLLNIPGILTLTIADLYLTIQSLMYGAVSQLLRRRLTDAELLTRKAIEAAATANRLFRHPDLLDTFKRAHEGIEARDGEGAWQPSPEYKKAFSMKNLFSEPKETWKTLRIDYEMFSVMATHAGLGSTVSQVTVKNARVLHFFETDDTNLDRVWYHLMATYLRILEIMHHVFRDNMDKRKAEDFEQDILWWQRRASTTMSKRAPWIKGKEVQGSNIIVVPF